MTYKELCNAVLRELNEVEITNVTSTRGIQSAITDFINKAQRDIINSEVEWPFTIQNDSDTTTDGQRLYAFESDAKTLKWSTFTVQETASLPEKRLSYISYDEYLDLYHESDTKPDGSAEGLPEYVYHTPDNKYGLSPTPDKSTYTIRYAYYATNTDMAVNDDTPVIPDRFHDVIINRAKYYAYLLRSDPQAAQFADRDYVAGLRRMRVELINRKDYMRAV
jgi:hypothetical protein